MDNCCIAWYRDDIMGSQYDTICGGSARAYGDAHREYPWGLRKYKQRFPVAEGIPLLQAARQLGIDKEALRKRALRGSVEAYKDVSTGQWFVVLPPSDTILSQRVDRGDGQRVEAGTPTGIPVTHYDPASSQALLDEKDARISLLSHELETRNTELDARRREVQELHVLLQNTQRLLIAPTTSPSAAQDAEGPHKEQRGLEGSVSPENVTQPPNLSIIERLKRLFTG
jgi:hypothetical protein